MSFSAFFMTESSSLRHSTLLTGYKWMILGTRVSIRFDDVILHLFTAFVSP